MKNEMYKVSIIIPVYNVEKYLRRCLDSVLYQKYKNIEIIIINDGSTDESKSICEEYEKKDKRVIFVNKENEGQAQARNVGLAIANGDVISFVDSDDVLNNNFYSELLSLMIKENADIVSCSFERFYDAVPSENDDNDNIEIYRGNNEILKEYLMPEGKNLIYHNIWNKIYKRETLNNITFNKGIIHDDLAIMYKILSNCSCLVTTSKSYYYYFKSNPNSITNNFSYKHILYSYEPILSIRNSFDKNKAIKKELNYFCVNQLICAYEQSYRIRMSKELLILRIKIFVLICKSFDNVSIKKKTQILIRIVFPGLHRKYVKKLKNKHE